MENHSVISRNQKPTSCNFKSADAFKDKSRYGGAPELVVFCPLGFRLAGNETGFRACWTVPPPPLPKGNW